MRQVELVKSIHSIFRECATCVTAEGRIAEEAAKDHILKFPIKVTGVHIKCELEPHSVARMGGTVKRFVTLEGEEKPFNGTLEKRSVHCPRVHGPIKST